MKIQIREYHKGDRVGCIEAFKSNVPHFFASKEIKLFENFLMQLESGEDKADFYVILGDGNVIGCGGFGDKNNSGIIALAWGLIHNQFHKKGYGEKLLTYRLKKVKELHPSAPLVVDTTQYCYGFFERFGFRTAKITMDYYEVGMHRYDMEFKDLSKTPLTSY